MSGGAVALSAIHGSGSLAAVAYVTLSLAARLGLCPPRLQYYVKMTHYAGCMTAASLFGMAMAVLFSIIPALRPKRHNIPLVVGQFFSTLATRILGINIVIDGELLPDDSDQAVIVANHQSSLDLIIMAAVFPRRCTVMAKKSLRNVPLLGLYLAMVKTVFIDRGNSQKARETMNAAVEHMKREKLSLFMYPEGTRSRTRERTMLPFKKGAFHLAVQADIPIVPVVFSAYDDIFDSKRRRFMGGTVHVKVLSPIPTEGIAADDREAMDALIEKTRNLMIQTYVAISPTVSANAAGAARAVTPGSVASEPTAASSPASAAGDGTRSISGQSTASAPPQASASALAKATARRRHVQQRIDTPASESECDSASMMTELGTNVPSSKDSLVGDQKLDSEDAYLDDYTKVGTDDVRPVSSCSKVPE